MKPKWKIRTVCAMKIVKKGWFLGQTLPWFQRMGRAKMIESWTSHQNEARLNWNQIWVNWTKGRQLWGMVLLFQNEQNIVYHVFEDGRKLIVSKKVAKTTTVWKCQNNNFNWKRHEVCQEDGYCNWKLVAFVQVNFLLK